MDNSSTNPKQGSLPGGAVHEMPLMEHIRELRARLLYSLIAICIGATVAYSLSDEIFYILCKPYFDSFLDSSLIGTGPADAFILKLKMAVASGIVLVSPFLFFQLWQFIAPGLYREEKLMVVPFLFFSTVLFLIGIWFAYAVVLPFSFTFFFEQYSSINLKPTIRVTEHLSFTAKALLSFGLVFEMPVLAYFLGRLGVITSETLIGGLRYAVVIIFILSAVLTPPDVLTQFLMAIPLLILYGISILIVKLTQPKNER